MDGNLELPVTFCQEPIVTLFSHKMELMVTAEQQRQLNGFAERLNQALDEIGVPAKGQNRQKIAGDMFGVSQKAARKWLEGISFPELWRLPGIAKKLKCTPAWLLFGDERKVAAKENATNEWSNFDSELLEFGHRLQNLSDKHKKKLLMGTLRLMMSDLLGKEPAETPSPTPPGHPTPPETGGGVIRGKRSKVSVVKKEKTK